MVSLNAELERGNVTSGQHYPGLTRQLRYTGGQAVSKKVTGGDRRDQVRKEQ